MYHFDIVVTKAILGIVVNRVSGKFAYQDFVGALFEVWYAILRIDPIKLEVFGMCMAGIFDVLNLLYTKSYNRHIELWLLCLFDDLGWRNCSVLNGRFHAFQNGGAN